ncbi:MAG: Uncharacterised protein [Polaribacter sp. SA4-10]|nr:MAG: Uncharacterised protein [Polaribacter sp. SA4-10]
MRKKLNLLFKPIEDKTIVWFAKKNEYIVLEDTAAHLLKELNKGVEINTIAEVLSQEMSIPKEACIGFVSELEERYFKNNLTEEPEAILDIERVIIPKNLEFQKFYKINDLIFKVEYSNEIGLSYVHPKFAHLEVNTTEHQHHFVVFIENKHLFLAVNNTIIKGWKSNEIHFFQGKFSMELIQAIHQNKEENWMGVFHASAVGNSKKTVLFLGDSGNGKSTSLAILQTNGFSCVADDFVPIDIKKQEVHSFPAAISIKKNSLDTLIPIYPELVTTAEYHFKRLNKIVRYLKPNCTDYKQHLPCNELIFIKYQKNAKLQFSKINKIEAFSQLIPDSWISPKKENAKVFLDWFASLKCYRLTYSNNDEMIKAVSKVFKNDA